MENEASLSSCSLEALQSRFATEPALEEPGSLLDFWSLYAPIRNCKSKCTSIMMLQEPVACNIVS